MVSHRLATWILGFLILGAASVPGQVGAPAARPLPSYADWRNVCGALPSNRSLGAGLAPRSLLPLRTYADFAAALDPFLDLCRTGSLARVGMWIDAPDRLKSFHDPALAYFVQATTPFQPFAQRHEVPPGTRVFFHGDLHGDIHSLLTYLDALNRDGVLEGFRITDEAVRLAFLGDYTDRGRYGVETLYTLLRLKLANPERVLMVRGNHEDISLVARYGFLSEIQGKYGRGFDIPRTVRLYDFLPAVLYLVSGTNVIQCNHGGMEPGYDPETLLMAPPGKAFHLLGRLDQRRFLAAEKSWIAGLPAESRRALNSSLADFEPESPIAPTVLGFMWNDFTVLGEEPAFAIDPGRAFVYGKETTRRILGMAGTPKHRIRAVFRAHQHSSELNPLMRRLLASRGIHRHWQEGDRESQLQSAPEKLRGLLETSESRPIPDGSVWTFNVSPDSVYGAGCGFTFDTAGELTVAERWEDWRLRVLNFEVATGRR
ncbi:MAG: metallophosphoesterase family protein [Limisphaerales bacterium]